MILVSKAVDSKKIQTLFRLGEMPVGGIWPRPHKVKSEYVHYSLRIAPTMVFAHHDGEPSMIGPSKEVFLNQLHRKDSWSPNGGLSSLAPQSRIHLDVWAVWFVLSHAKSPKFSRVHWEAWRSCTNCATYIILIECFYLYYKYLINCISYSIRI